MKREQGITLVALVVTILIMLILAGVTIGLVTGENGLFKMAQQGVDKYKTSQKNEESTMQEISDELYGLIGKGKDDKTPGEITGEGTEAKPFLIESIEDLVQFSNKVNGGTTYENQVIKLTVNLDFQSEDSYADSKNKIYGDINGTNGAEELKTELTTGKGFKSIGNNNQQFKGTFDGQNRTISNLYINVAENYKGLFGYVGSNGTIKDLIISNANINCEALYIGTLAGRIDGGKIENVKISSGNLQGNRYVGGITGVCINESTINNCLSSANIIGNGAIDTDNNIHLEVAGIAGYCANSTIMNSHNLGPVYATRGLGIGGITGVAGNSIIDSCHNEGNLGDLKDSFASHFGGIVGDAGSNTKVTKCYNSGDIGGDNNIGGIVGLLGNNSMAYIEDCYNTGTISTNRETGGIGGISAVSGITKGCEIKNCYNIGNILATASKNDSAGSLVGRGNEENTKVTNCYYLSGTYTGGINGKDTAGTVKKEKGEMTTQEFVNLLNSGSEEKPWKMGNKYPILSWQE